MRVIIENKIPFIEGTLETLGVDTAYLAPEEITPSALHDADALIVRTRTRCDRALLENSRVSFVATATIGTDHLDLPYLRSRGITTASAPGCNAPAVAQYVLSAIEAWQPGCQLTIGIVGVGHVGSIVARWGRSLGHHILCCDPPRALAEGTNNFVSIDEIARQSDVITFHTPLTTTGSHPTLHMANREFFDSLKRKPLIINSARGPVINTGETLRALGQQQIAAVAIDTWEGEPHINADLLQKAFIATPHIAGYSIEGKKRATAMVLDALTTHFHLPKTSIAEPAPTAIPQHITLGDLGYNPLSDTIQLKSSPDAFESLRNNYHLRHEPAPN